MVGSRYLIDIQTESDRKQLVELTRMLHKQNDLKRLA
jgi:hypothetical protein